MTCSLSLASGNVIRILNEPLTLCSCPSLHFLWLYVFRERTDRDQNVINLILHLFRNLAAIEDRKAKSTASTEAIEQSHLQVRIITESSIVSMENRFLLKANVLHFIPFHSLT